MKPNTNIFEFLDWVLKKNKKPEPIDENNIPPWLFNRWMTMSDSDIANIVNVTYNRWMTSESETSTVLDMARFYRVLLPKNTAHIKYIKKPIPKVKSEEIVDDMENSICNNMEISKREYKYYNQTLAELNYVDK